MTHYGLVGEVGDVGDVGEVGGGVVPPLPLPPVPGTGSVVSFLVQFAVSREYMSES